MATRTFPKVGWDRHVPGTKAKASDWVRGELVVDGAALEHRSKGRVSLRMDPVREVSVNPEDRDRIVVVYGQGAAIRRARFGPGLFRTKALASELEEAFGSAAPLRQDEAAGLRWRSGGLPLAEGGPDIPGSARAEWRSMIDRLAVAQQEPIVDRERVEGALAEHFRVLGLPRPEIHWMDDPVRMIREMKGPFGSREAAKAMKEGESAFKTMDRSVRDETEAAAQEFARVITATHGFQWAFFAAREATRPGSGGSVPWVEEEGPSGSLVYLGFIGGAVFGWGQAKHRQAAAVARRAFSATATACAREAVYWTAAREAADRVGAGHPALDRLVEIWSPFLDAIEGGLWLYHLDPQGGVIAVPPPAEGGVETVSLEQSVPDTVGDDEELERPEEELRPLDEVELTPGLEDQVRAAWERLPHAAKNEPELNLLLELLGHDRELLALVGAMQGLKSGVLAVTDSRLLLVRGIVRAKHEEIPLSSVLSVSQVGERTIVLELAWGKPVKFENVRPSEETPAVVEAIRARLNGPAA